MAKQKPNNIYDVVYRTKSGRTMVTHGIEAKTMKAAAAKLKQNMRASSSFDKVVLVIKKH
jgi:hypothetical protein